MGIEQNNNNNGNLTKWNKLNIRRSFDYIESLSS